MIYNAGNPGWSGSLFTGIPASGYRTNGGLAPVLGPLNDAKGGLEQLPIKDGFTFGAGYFLTRGISTSIATDYFSNPWVVVDPSCLGDGCAKPPGQYCRSLKCPHLSYPMYGETCISAEALRAEIGKGTGIEYIPGTGT